MISSDDIDLMGWNSPSNPPSTRALPKPLIPTVNVQSPCMINNPFDDVCEKITGEIQNPFDDICSLVEKQTEKKTAKQCREEHDEVNLLNMTIITHSAREDEEDLQNLSAISNPETNISVQYESSDILNLSSLDDNLLDINDKVAEDLQLLPLLDNVKETCRVRENNNCLSQFQCDYSQANTSMNDSYYEHGQQYHELCSKLDSSFNRSKSHYDQIVTHDQEVLAKFKRRSAEFSNKKAIEEREKKNIEKVLSTSQTVSSKSALKPLQSPNLKIRTCSSLRTLPLSVRTDTGGSTRQGPMKAIAPLKSMIKSSNNLADKTDTKEKSQAAPMFKSSYHKSPIKTLNLRSKSAPRLTSSTPEKSSSLPRASFSSPSPLKSFSSQRSPSPLKSVATSPIKSLESNACGIKSFGISPLKSVGTSPIKSLEIETSPSRHLGSLKSLKFPSSRSFKFPPSPLKLEKTSHDFPTTILASPLKREISNGSLQKPNPLVSGSGRSVSTSQLKLARGSPLKSSSANVGGALAPSAGSKPRSSSLSRLKPPRSIGSKVGRINMSHEEKENIAVQYVL